MTRGERADGVIVALVALLARLAVVVWAGGRFGATADGVYYQRLAERLASGAGYTWAWPDGAVTYAAHYPVGYPLLLSLLYRVTGPSVAAAGVMNAVLGAAGAWAMHGLCKRAMPRRAALVGAMTCALDPALVMYTPAIMTEGVTASLLSMAALAAATCAERGGDDGVGGASRWAGLGGRWGPIAACGAAVGVATLVRPQCVLLAPVFGAWAASSGVAPHAWGWARRAVGAATATAGALVVCLPWTLRNCARMGRCALVSVNGGWNLLIGAGPKANGHWAPVDVPSACKTVFDEAAKDVCFGESARQIIAADLPRWLALVPAKLSATFDYCGAAPWYLHEANGAAFTWRDKVTWGAIETALHRFMLLGALVALGRGAGPRALARKVVAMVGAVFVVQREGYVGYVALVAVALLGAGGERRGNPVAFAVAAVVGSTLLVHAAFFGAGRYGLPVFPFVAACVGAVLTGLPARGDTADHAAHRDGRSSAPAGEGDRERSVALSRRQDLPGHSRRYALRDTGRRDRRGAGALQEPRGAVALSKELL